MKTQEQHLAEFDWHLIGVELCAIGYALAFAAFVVLKILQGFHS